MKIFKIRYEGTNMATYDNIGIRFCLPLAFPIAVLFIFFANLCFAGDAEPDARYFPPLARSCAAYVGKIILFENFTLGMWPQEVIDETDAIPCDGLNPSDSLCSRKPVEFAGLEWEQIFAFKKGRLARVMLLREGWDQDSFLSVIHALVARDFSLAYMENGERSLDLFTYIVSNGRDAAITATQKFIYGSAQYNTDLIMEFLPTPFIDKAIEKRLPDYYLALSKAPEDLRSTLLMLKKDDICLIFGAPIAQRKMEMSNTHEDNF